MNSKIWLKEGLIPKYFEGSVEIIPDGVKIKDYRSQNTYKILNSQIEKSELYNEKDSIWNKKY